MYRKEPLISEIPIWLGRLLQLFRFLLITALSFLLLGPMIRTFSREVEKPIIILALDQSKSILNSKDSVARRTSVKSDFDFLREKLEGDYDVRTYSFGDHVSEKINYEFTDRLTDFSSLYNQLDVQFSNRNVGAVILATDGLYNENASPVYGPSRLKVPVYSIALGDTTVRKDLLISAVNHNKIAFLGNSFPMEVVLDARQAAGSRTTLTILEDSSQIFTRPIDIRGINFHTSIPVFVDAKSKGIHHYKIKLSSVEGEVTLINNERDIFVEVVEQKLKVLILSAAPNPDVSAIRQTLESSLNYEVVTDNLSSFSGRIGDFNLVILHNIPGNNADGKAVIEKIVSSGVSVWYILGASTAVDGFNAAGAGMVISQANGQLNDAQASVVGDFSLFNLSEALKAKIPSWPPLKVPFGMYQVNTNVYALLNQRIGIVNTSQPLLYFTEKDGRKQAVLSGEGLWKWRLADFNEQGNHELSQELILHIVQYLSVKENRSPFRVLAKNNYKENESLIFDAQLYNQSDQWINEPDIRLKIYNSAGKEFQFAMSRNDKAYILNAGIFPIGNYKYAAEVKLGDKILRQQGQFSVSALQVETSITIADHQLLNALAGKTGGAVYYPGKAADLLKAITSNENLKSISYMHKKLEDLLNESWFFFLLILLLSIEWFIRKRSGSY